MAVRGLSTVRDREPRTSTSTFTQRLSSENMFVDATLNCQGRSEPWSRVKVEVAVLGSPSLISLYGLCGRRATLNCQGRSKLRSCLTVEVAVLGSPSPTVLNNGLCGRKATLNLNLLSKLRSCVKVDVAVLGSPPLAVLTVSVDVKRR